MNPQDIVTVKISRSLMEKSKKYIGDGKSHSTQLNLLNQAVKNYLVFLRANLEGDDE